MKTPAMSPTPPQSIDGRARRICAWSATYGIFFSLVCMAIHFHREMNFHGGEARDRALHTIAITSSLVMAGTAAAWFYLFRQPPADRAHVIGRCKLGIRLAYIAFILDLVAVVATEKNLPEVNQVIGILLFIPTFPLSCVLSSFSIGDANDLPEICLGLLGGAAYYYLIGIYFSSVRRAFRRHRQRRITGSCCEACGYDLRVDASGVCPECGTPRVAPSTRPERPISPQIQ